MLMPLELVRVGGGDVEVVDVVVVDDDEDSDADDDGINISLKIKKNRCQVIDFHVQDCISLCASLTH